MRKNNRSLEANFLWMGMGICLEMKQELENEHDGFQVISLLSNKTRQIDGFILCLRRATLSSDTRSPHRQG